MEVKSVESLMELLRRVEVRNRLWLTKPYEPLNRSAFIEANKN